jgi:type III restriction enzyme
LLLLVQFAHAAADKIYQAIVSSYEGQKTLQPILAPYDTIGSTRHVDFDTTRDVYKTHPDRCHISHVALDSGWEAKLAQSLEDMEEVICYAKNQNLGFVIPYTINGEEKNYYPDYLVKISDGKPDPINLILEVTGEKKKEKADKVAAARNLWIPSVNNHATFGRWLFLEITDPWNAITLIRELVTRRT